MFFQSSLVSRTFAATLLMAAMPSYAELTCDFVQTSTKKVLETQTTDHGILIGRYLGNHKYVIAGYNSNPNEGPKGYRAVIFDGTKQSPEHTDAEVIAESSGHKDGESFSVEDRELDLSVNCSAK